MRQLGAIMAELSDHRFEKIGSIFDDANGGYFVGDCLSPSFTWQGRDTVEMDRGPFQEERDYLMSFISSFTTHVQEVWLTPHVFFAPVPEQLDYDSVDSHGDAIDRWNDFVAIGQKVGRTKNVLMYCVAAQFLREMVPDLCWDEGNTFTLSHPGLHAGNLYVDDDFNITCIIDWGSTSAGPITELLAAPSMASSAAPPSNFLTAAFRSGFLQRNSKMASDISRCNLWEKSEKVWYFSRLVRLLSRNDYRHFKNLFELVYKTSAEDAGGGKGIIWLLHERANRDENKELVARLEVDDPTAEEVQGGGAGSLSS